MECHDGDVHKAGLRLDQLKPVSQDPASLALWTRIHDRVLAGEMPPKKKLSADETIAFTDTLAKQLTVTDQTRQRTAGRVAERRLNRVEYENTLRDLLALPELEVKDILPPDPTSGGFDNVASAQDVSYVHVARYLEAADSALRLRVVVSAGMSVFTMVWALYACVPSADNAIPSSGAKAAAMVVQPLSAPFAGVMAHTWKRSVGATLLCCT